MLVFYCGRQNDARYCPLVLSLDRFDCESPTVTPFRDKTHELEFTGSLSTSSSFVQ